ncbi:hypothetical protein DICVIV_05280 [Dictyocaulus viviparus]|uniref:Uncharacterized protein n=1 Tax=Dictyocaulus viviparus TaxID=29172 RepID=A0A0D8XVC5_DICVI|nr:hypothetical protein DICVIV_05280 [Dictyocaulus viviparus]
MERPQDFRERERGRSGRDETIVCLSSHQPKQRIQNYNARGRDFCQNDREWNRGEQYLGSEQLTWQQREMERNDNYRQRQGTRDYNYRQQRQCSRYDDDREELVPEDPRVDRNDGDSWSDVPMYHHDQFDYPHKPNRHCHRPCTQSAYRGRSRGYFSNRQVKYGRDDNRRDVQEDDRADRESSDNKEHSDANTRNNSHVFYRPGGKIYDSGKSMDSDRDKHSERSLVFYNSNKTHFSDRRRRGSNSNYN